MRSRQGLVLDTARNVQAFLDDNAAIIGPNIASSRRNLDDGVAQLTAMAITQSGGKIASRGATARQRSLRASLRANHMKPIADVAKLMLTEVPEFQSLTMPAKQLGAAQLVASAQGMADAAAPHTSTFTELGLPDDFIGQLRDAADAVTTSLDGRQQQSGQAAGATAGIAAQERRLRSLFKLINALVLPKLGTNVVLLAQWKNTRAISSKTNVVTTPLPVTEPTPEPVTTTDPVTPQATAEPSPTPPPAA